MVNALTRSRIESLTLPQGPPVAGVDGCRGGWLAVRLDPAAGTTEAAVFARWAELDGALADAAAIAVDMPVGLADAGPRRCDVAARALLQPAGKGSSVFPSPRRYMLGRSWTDANALGRAREGTGLTRQAGHILPKVAELDRALGPAHQDRVLETHPEVAFHRLNGWRALPPKRRVAGRAPRLALLAAAGLAALEALLEEFPRRLVQPDDLLDAGACALVAADYAAGRARRVPAGAPPRDARGLRMEIWY